MRVRGEAVVPAPPERALDALRAVMSPAGGPAGPYRDGPRVRTLAVSTTLMDGAVRVDDVSVWVVEDEGGRLTVHAVGNGQGGHALAASVEVSSRPVGAGRTRLALDGDVQLLVPVPLSRRTVQDEAARLITELESHLAAHVAAACAEPSTGTPVERARRPRPLAGQRDAAGPAPSVARRAVIGAVLVAASAVAWRWLARRHGSGCG